QAVEINFVPRGCDDMIGRKRLRSIRSRPIRPLDFQTDPSLLSFRFAHVVVDKDFNLAFHSPPQPIRPGRPPRFGYVAMAFLHGEQAPVGLRHLRDGDRVPSKTESRLGICDPLRQGPASVPPRIPIDLRATYDHANLGPDFLQKSSSFESGLAGSNDRDRA